jgi:hypothetical protein
MPNLRFLPNMKNATRRNDVIASRNVPSKLGRNSRINPSAAKKENPSVARKGTNSHKKTSPPNPRDGERGMQPIVPPRLHREMRIICDEFGITDQAKYALRKFDATRVEDFSLMTNDDFEDLVRTEAGMGRPLCPLQQRKLRVLLAWAQSLANEVNSGEDGIVIDRFYSDLPMLRKQLQTLGERQSRSDWVTMFASFLFCDCYK